VFRFVVVVVWIFWISLSLSESLKTGSDRTSFARGGRSKRVSSSREEDHQQKRAIMRSLC
jgi:hypothetical protein